MTLDDLRAAGQALYGPAWQSALSRDLHVSDRTMRRWVAGTHAIPETLRGEVVALLAKKELQVRRTKLSLEIK